MKQYMKNVTKWILISILALAVIVPSSVAVAQVLSPAGQVFTGLRFFIDGVEMNVEWNEAENSVHLTSPEGVEIPVLVQPDDGVSRERIPLVIAAPHFDAGGSFGNIHSFLNVQTVDATMGGTTFKNAIGYSGTIWGTTGRSNIFSSHNLRGQYTVFEGHVGRVDGSAMVDATVIFHGDGGNILATYEILRGELPVEFSVSVENVNLLRIEFLFRGIFAQTGIHFALAGYLE